MSRRFSPEEDTLICTLREEGGVDWDNIADRVSALGAARTRDAVRLRYFFYLSPNRASNEPAKSKHVRRGKQRNCMNTSCGRLFWSQHAGVRFCSQCRFERRDDDNCLAPLSFGSGLVSSRPTSSV